MDTLLVQEGLKRLDALAAKLGVAVNQLWAALLAQAPVEWIDVYVATPFVALGFLIIGFGVWLGVKKDWDTGGAIALFGVAATSFLTMWFLSELIEALKATANPAFYALMKLKGLL